MSGNKPDATRRSAQSLPSPHPSLIGRANDSSAVRRMLLRDNVRLVTLTGPGGVGKTSLALQVAHDLRDAFPDGNRLISLAPISDSTLILQTIAGALDVVESPNRLLLDSLKDFLSQKQTLLLLDNFEQVIAAAPLLSELLAACPTLKLLVTSREALRLRGEHVFPVPPLALAQHGELNALSQSPSIALFVQRAQAVQPDFQLTRDNADAVSEICARLDGLPLAIELAAARIKLLPPRAMLERLRESPLQLLTQGTRDLPTRQQTLRNTVQWSYDLLSDDEQRAFRLLSAFVGGCALDTALAMLAQPHALDVLDSLVNKSLLRQIEMDGAPRLTILETIREFGLEQLAQTNELHAARHAHATHFLQLAVTAEPHLIDASQLVWRETLEREQDNLRAALRWAIESRNAEFAQRLSGALWHFWFARGYWSEGRRWLEESLALQPADTDAPGARATALLGAAALARYQGDFARTQILSRQSAALFRAIGDDIGLLSALLQQGYILNYQDDPPVYRELLEEAMRLTDSLSDSPAKATACSELVVVLANTSGAERFADVARYLETSERINLGAGNQAGLAFNRLWRGIFAMESGDFAQADVYLDEAERLARESGDYRTLSRAMLNRMGLDSARRDYASARQRAAEYIEIAERIGDYQTTFMLSGMARGLYAQGLYAWAARVFGLADARADTRERRASLDKYERRYGIAPVRDQLRAKLGEAAYASEMALGQRLSLRDLLAIPQPQIDAADSPDALTTREIEVLRLLAQDMSNPQIADRLVVSRRTVDAHLRSIYDKLGVKSRDGAIRVAKERRLIQ